MFNIRATAAVISALLLSGCAQGGDGEMTTGSIMPAMPSLPSASTLTSLVPSIGAASNPRAPERVSGNIYRVFSGDRKIDDTIQRQNYALLRAAEATKQAGGTHFVVVNGSDTADSRNASALIRIMKLEPGLEAPVGAVAADEIIHFFGPAFGRADQASPAIPPAPSSRG